MAARMLCLLVLGSAFVSGCGAAIDNENSDLDAADSGAGAAPASGNAGSPAGASSGGSGGKPAAAGGGATAAGGGASAGKSGAGAAAMSGTGGSGNMGGVGNVGGMSAAGGPAAGSGGAAAPTVPTEKFSFFVTSLKAMQRLSKSDKGFGGDLRYGEATGLAGADKICTEIAESSMPGSGAKVWHAFLSAKSAGAGSSVVHAKDRIGKGPWYDRTGRIIAMSLDALLSTRPSGADPAIADNLPNEDGEPNRASEDIDNHDTVTGSNAAGEYSGGATCEDWTTVTTPAADGGGGRGGGSRGPMCGHSWPAQSGQSWIQAHNAPGCAPSVSLTQMGGGSGDGIGNSGGYGGIYCFALSP